MNVIYISPTQLPSTSAHTVHVAKMCEAFANNGHNVVLVCPVISKPVKKEDIFKFYNIAPVFKIKYFKQLNVKGKKIINSLRLATWLLFQKKDIIVSRDINASIYISFFGMKNIFDAHDIPPEKKFNKKLINRFYKSNSLVKLTVVSNKMKEIFVEKGIPANKIFIVRNGASEPKSNLKNEAITGNHYFNVGYAGHLYSGKGMEVISAVAPLLSNTIIHIVGGNEADIKQWKKRTNSSNIIFYGFVPQADLAVYINSFDVCLLPNQKSVLGVGGKQDIGEITCPLKMLDYMAFRKPIIASDLPVLKEVLDEKSALFCSPEKPAEWVSAIEKLRDDATLRNNIANNAYDLFLNNYTWQQRAKNLLLNVKEDEFKKL